MPETRAVGNVLPVVPAEEVSEYTTAALYDYWQFDLTSFDIHTNTLQVDTVDE